MTRGVDPTLRYAESPAEAIRSRVPGPSHDLALRLNQFGEERRRTGAVGTAMLNPLTRSADRRASDPVTAEVARVGVTVPLFKRIEGQAPEQHNERQRLYGQELRAPLAELIESDDYPGILEQAEETLRQDPAALARGAQAEEVEKLVQQIRRDFTAYEREQREAQL